MWFFILGCAVAAWAVGFGISYRRGVRDAMTGDLIRADHRVSGD
jgi:hypothetical protein